MTKPIIILVIAAIILSCTSTTFAYRLTNARQNLYLEDGDVETRVYTRRQCLLSETKVLAESQPEFVGVLLGIFVPLLIEKGLGLASTALKKAGSPKTMEDFGRRPTYLYQIANKDSKLTLDLNPDNRCVLVVRGTFLKHDETEQYAQSKVDYSNGEGIFKNADDVDRRKRILRLQASNIPVESIEFVYEARIRVADDKTAVTYDSRFLEVNGFQSSESSDRRAIVVKFAFHGVSSKEGEQILSLGLMNLGEIEKYTVLGPSNIQQRQSGWLGGLGINENSLKAIEKMKVTVGKPKGVMPVTLEATIVEVSKANDALLFIAELLDSTKKQVADAVAKDLLDGKEEAKTAADALEKLKESEESAYREYLKATTALSAACSSIDAARVTEAQKTLIFERDRTFRIWSDRHNLLKTYGEASADRSTTKFRCSNGV